MVPMEVNLNKQSSSPNYIPCGHSASVEIIVCNCLDVMNLRNKGAKNNSYYSEVSATEF